MEAGDAGGFCDDVEFGEPGFLVGLVSDVCDFRIFGGEGQVGIFFVGS